MNRAKPIRLSACLIVRDEERRLPDCLASVAFCDEIVVVDSGSSDRTMEIARAAGATVLERPWRGFAAQRNIALDAARGEWALEVDADERITPRLREQIVALVADPPPGVDNAVIPLRQVYLGARLGPSALYPAGRVRLLRRDRYRHDDRRTVHEGIWPAGPSAYPSGDLEHILAESMRESLRDLRSYTLLESRQLPEVSRVRAIAVGIVLRPAAKCVYRAWLLGGWRDGVAGITKILLDCIYDSFTWGLSLRVARRPAEENASETDDSSVDADTDDRGHFGRSFGYSGPVRIVAVARGAQRTSAALAWLEHAGDEHADVALITDTPQSQTRVRQTRVRTVEITGRGPLAVLRAIAWEEQLNPIEILLLPSSGGRIASRLLPGHLRGVVPPVSLRANPRELIDAALALRPKAR